MKIQTIEITNYKAFLGKHTLKVRGKNVFIYGENGSGKSSLYYALKDLFQSSIEAIDFGQLENIFTAEAKQGSGKVRITLKGTPTRSRWSSMLAGIIMDTKRR